MHINTPLIHSLPLSRIVGSNVWLKVDALQPSGSFKARGIGFACKRYLEKGAKRFISSSGGNAGLAVAYAGRKLSTPVIVVVPESTAERAKDLIRLESAEVIVHGATWQEAHAYAISLVDQSSAYLHPFDDPLIWEGHASIVDELIATGLKPDAVVLSVGGGGLLCGVAQGLRNHGLNETKIITAETTGADSFAKSVSANSLIELESITSIATSLGAKKVAIRALEVFREFNVYSSVVSDRQAVDACLEFLNDHRVLTEPACGASLAVAYQNHSVLKGKNIVIVVCGGACITHEKLLEFKQCVA